MTIASVTYVSQREAREHLPKVGEHLISITDGHSPSFAATWEAVYRMVFMDIEWDRDTLRVISLSGLIEAKVFEPGMAIKLRAQLHRWHTQVDRVDVWVHCHAGESRSAAIAEYIRDTYRVPLRKEPSAKRNKTVSQLMTNPWSIVTEAEYDAATKPGWYRAVKYGVRSLLGGRPSMPNKDAAQ